ncbi:protein trichome berefringence-like 7 isoform X1 [Actinidia eriantha]|uniref:protein trichome berefringence-like 7 isoform X1 n=1 Tax=Actinidia eriantha TaxID=165200 RepID=UPI002589A3C4|nr:protein trichome berefringence-like 7 isoform X1 [Actinidia eriantha]
MVCKLNSNLFGYLRPYTKRVLSFGHPIGGSQCKSKVCQSLNGVIIIGSFLCFLLAMACGYKYVLPESGAIIPNYVIPDSSHSNSECNFFDGRWVPDESYPLYNSSECPFAEQGFDCLANGRRDSGYLRWRWKPKNCQIPRFNVHAVLEKLRGKRVVFVGDSLSRTQWESMICLLMTGVEDKKSVYEVNGNKISKHIRYLGVRFGSFDFTVEFYRSVFLVQPGSVPKRAPKRVKSTLKLDVLDDISKEWIDSDVLIFNSGHWWTPGKLFEMGWYFQAGGKMKLGMSISAGFRTAIATWASWIENMVDTNKTRVFFRTFESSHWSGGTRQKCKVTRRPLSKTKGRDRSPFSNMVLNVVKNLSIPVTVLHVTPMGAIRSDAHVGTWSDNPLVPDCSHWCLPGVPDMWNEILFSYLLSQESVSLQGNGEGGSGPTWNASSGPIN